MQRCAFCHEYAKLSGEHIWSDWINRLLGPSRSYSFRRVGEDGSVLNEWQSRELDLTANVVCVDCNNGWMADIENDHAKPTIAGILVGNPLSLLPRGLASLAIWSFKLAVVADHLRSQRPSFFTEEARTNFRTRQAIPYGVQMWFGAFHDPGTRNGIFNTHYLQIRDGRHRGFEYFVMNYGIAPLLLQVTAPRWTGTSPRRTDIPFLTQNDFWNPIALPFWPPDGKAAQWPPPTYIGNDLIRGFSNRFQNLRAPKSQVECNCKAGWVCEAHPELAWPHDDCPGPGMRCENHDCPWWVEHPPALNPPGWVSIATTE